MRAIFLFICTCIFLLDSYTLARSAPVELPLISLIESSAQGDLTRLTLISSQPLEIRTKALAAPNRFILDMSEVNFQVNPKTGDVLDSHKPFAGAIQGFRFGLFSKGQSRIVIDMARPARLIRNENTPLKNGQYKLTLEWENSDQSSFEKQLSQELIPTTHPSSPILEKADQKPVIVLDPGHGGVDSGALSTNKALEKNITLSFAEMLKTKLEATNRYHIYMTRNSDVFISLSDRVRFSRAHRADLFISLHADTFTNQSNISGATIYTLSKEATDAESAKLADIQNQVDAASGMDKEFDATEDVSDILLDLTRRETRTYAHLFSRSVVTYWQASGHLNKNPNRSAGFQVLTAPDVPSVLLELGYLSNAQDSQALESPQWRTQATDALVKSINAFFDLKQQDIPKISAKE